MRVLFVSAEIFPFAKAGGLADVSAALPAAFAQLDVDVRLLVPGYRSILSNVAVEFIRPSDGFQFDFGALGNARIVEARLPDSKLPIWLVDCPQRYDRPGGPYQDEVGRPWVDNLERFVLLSRCAAALATAASPMEWKPDVVHCNDWHAGLTCASLLSADRRARTVFTVHNRAFAGTFPLQNAPLLGLPMPLLSNAGIGTTGGFSLLKAGIAYADWVTTVSPTYAREIRTPVIGDDIAALLERRVESFSGILNGVDYRTWDPVHDTLIAATYYAADLSGKTACRAALVEAFDVAGDARAPLFGCVSRLAEQKGIDLIPAALARALESGCRFVLLGRGDRRIENAIAELGRRFPGRVSARFEFNEQLAHAVEAGADIFLMPSRFEPCGLNQMYSMRYGTPPIVHAVGGLADSVVDTNVASMQLGTATGFTFALPDAEAFADAIARSLAVYARPQQWRAVQQTGMRRDFSWSRSAREYLDLYRSL